jgi:hypothetical protein
VKPYDVCNNIEPEKVELAEEFSLVFAVLISNIGEGSQAALWGDGSPNELVSVFGKWVYRPTLLEKILIHAEAPRLQLRRNKFLHLKSWVADNGLITGKNHGNRDPNIAVPVGRVLFHHITTSLIEISLVIEQTVGVATRVRQR